MRWECPPEFSQWRGRPGGAQASLPPPGLVTNISLAQPVARKAEERGRSREATPTSSAPAPASVPTSAKSSLVSGYDSDDSDESSQDNSETSLDPNKTKPGFIGPIIPDKEEKLEPDKSRSNSKECEDILSLIEAENPPDYVETKPVILPSTAKKESSKPKGSSSILQLASNYDDSDQGESDDNSRENSDKKNLTQLDNYGRLVFGKDSESNGDWQTEEQRKALEMYKIEESKNKKNSTSESKANQLPRYSKHL